MWSLIQSPLRNIIVLLLTFICLDHIHSVCSVSPPHNSRNVLLTFQGYMVHFTYTYICIYKRSRILLPWLGMKVIIRKSYLVPCAYSNTEVYSKLQNLKEWREAIITFSMKMQFLLKTEGELKAPILFKITWILASIMEIYILWLGYV